MTPVWLWNDQGGVDVWMHTCLHTVAAEQKYDRDGGGGEGDGRGRVRIKQSISRVQKSKIGGAKAPLIPRFRCSCLHSNALLSLWLPVELLHTCGLGFVLYCTYVDWA